MQAPSAVSPSRPWQLIINVSPFEHLLYQRRFPQSTAAINHDEPALTPGERSLKPMQLFLPIYKFHRMSVSKILFCKYTSLKPTSQEFTNISRHLGGKIASPLRSSLFHNEHHKHNGHGHIHQVPHHPAQRHLYKRLEEQRQRAKGHA